MQVTQNGSRFQPPDRHHHADLAERDAPIAEPLDLGNDLNFVDEACLEVSRQASRARGMLLALGCFGAMAATVGGYFLLSHGRALFTFATLGAVLLTLACAGLLVLSVSLVRTDLTQARDEPVRFNRRTGKVYVNGLRPKRFPFGRLVYDIQVHEWNSLQAEQLRYLSFNSRFMVLRYGLDLVACRPGTWEVVGRFWMVRNAMAIESAAFAAKWAYIRAFMNGADVEALAATAASSKAPSFSQALVRYLPYLDTSPEGRRWAETASGCFIMLLLVLVTPVLLPFALSHYMALRLAPPVHWPDEIDVASRGGGSPETRQERSGND